MIILDIGSRIKKQRLKHKLTQKKLAKELGVSPKMISFYENNQRTPPADLMKSIAIFFCISTDYILGLSDEENDNRPKITVTKEEKKLIDIFRSLNSDYKIIIVGKAIECLKMQEYENFVADKDISKKQA